MDILEDLFKQGLTTAKNKAMLKLAVDKTSAPESSIVVGRLSLIRFISCIQIVNVCGTWYDRDYYCTSTILVIFLFHFLLLSELDIQQEEGSQSVEEDKSCWTDVMASMARNE